VKDEMEEKVSKWRVIWNDDARSKVLILTKTLVLEGNFDWHDEVERK